MAVQRSGSAGVFSSLKNIFNNTVGIIEERAAMALESVQKSKMSGLHDIQRISVSDNTEIAQQESRYIDRFSYLTFDTMNMMANRDVIVSAIITRRAAQVAKFARPANKKNVMGFTIRVKEGLESEDPTEQERDAVTVRELTQFVSNTGHMDGRPKEDMMNFEEFLKRETTDLLKFDQVSIEKIPAYDGSLFCFFPVDSSTTRFARQTTFYPPNVDEARVSTLETDREDARMAELEQRLEDTDPKDIKYVQLIAQKITAYYTYDDLVFRTFSSTNDIRLNGYSLGPLEKLINIITSHINAESHNQLFFQQGFVTRGILAVKGNVNQTQLEAFKRQWYSQVSGAGNSWRTPVVGGENIEIQWVPLQMSNRDMEWDVWMHYLVKCICAIYLIAPQEIGWDVNTGIISAAGDSGKRNMVLLTESKDVGLEPILRFFENIINEEIFVAISPEIAERYEFRFTGLGADNPTEQTERLVRQLTNYKTLDEIRIEDGLTPVGSPLGDMILNPTLIPFYTAMYFPEEPDSDSSGEAKNKVKENDRETKSAKKKSRQAKH